MFSQCCSGLMSSFSSKQMGHVVSLAGVPTGAVVDTPTCLPDAHPMTRARHLKGTGLLM